MAKVKKRHSSYLKTLEDLIYEAADKADIDREEGKDLIDEYFLRVQALLTDPRLPKVSIPKLGTFSVPVTAIRYLLSRKIRNFKKGTYTRFYASIGIRRLWKVYRRGMDHKHGKSNCNAVWHEMDPEKFKENVIENVRTDIPDDYFTMDYKNWFKFIKSEPRFDVNLPSKRKLSILYNSLRGRLINIDKIEGIEKTLTAEGFDTFKRVQGRKSAEEESMAPITWAILTNNFDWTLRVIKDKSKFSEYDKKSIR